MADIRVDVMRLAIIDAYKYSPTWPDKVKRFSEAQVTALYLKFKKEGKIK